MTSRTAKSSPYQQPEGFCLMLYQGEQSKRVLDIWNSRNGVTPFCALIDGEEYKHIAWKFDRRVPDHQLRPGDYFWRDMTREEAERFAAIRCDAFERAGYPSDMPRAELIAQVADEIWHDGKAPYLDRAPFITVVDND
jgi:hypothetical protein